MNQKGAMVEGRTMHKHVKEKIVFLKYSISKATVKYTYIYIYIYYIYIYIYIYVYIYKVTSEITNRVSANVTGNKEQRLFVAKKLINSQKYFVSTS